MSKILIANWKMNPKTEAEAVKLAKASDFEDVVICPPFVYLHAVSKVLKKAELGAQDVFWEAESGPFTGEVAAKQLKGLGARYVIVGHSERRQNFSETDEMIAHKVVAVLSVGMTPILCIGETRAEREVGQAQEIVDRQLKIVLSQLPMGTQGELLVAYEPVWAISTNAAGIGALNVEDAPKEAVNMVRFLAQVASLAPVPVRFIYGGSVDSKNVEEVLRDDLIEGALVGGASLRAAEFKKMIELRGV